MIKDIGINTQYKNKDIICTNMNRSTAIQNQTIKPNKDNSKQDIKNVEVKEPRATTKIIKPITTSIPTKNDDFTKDCYFEAKMNINENFESDSKSVYNKIMNTNTDGFAQRNMAVETPIPLDREKIYNNYIKIKENTGKDRDMPVISDFLDNETSGQDTIIYDNSADETTIRNAECLTYHGNFIMKHNNDENHEPLSTNNSIFPNNMTKILGKTVRKSFVLGSLNANKSENNEQLKIVTIVNASTIKNEDIPMEELSFHKVNSIYPNIEAQFCNAKPVSGVDTSIKESIDNVSHGEENTQLIDYTKMKIKCEANTHKENVDSDILSKTDSCDIIKEGLMYKTSDSDNEGYDPEDDMSLKNLIDLYSDGVKLKLDEETQPFQWSTPCFEDTRLDVPEPINGEYICPLCNGHYSTEYNFTTHKCSNKPCTDFTAFNKTLKKSTLISPDPIKMDITEVKVKKRDGRSSRRGIDLGPYVCYICKKTICRRSGLNVHVRRHLKDAPYECEYCKKRFVVLYDLDRHTASHLGGRRFRFMCELCVKPFVSKCSLIQHMKIIHCKKASFTCKICMIPFPQEFRLKRHIQQHIEYDINQSTVIDESLKILESIEQTKDEMSKVLDESLKEIDLNEAELLPSEQSQMELVDLQQSGVIDDTLVVTDDPSVENRSNIIEKCLKLANIQESDSMNPKAPTSSNEIHIELIDMKGENINNNVEIISSNVIDVVNPSLLKLFPSDYTDFVDSNRNESISTQRTTRSYPTIEIVPLKRSKNIQPVPKTLNELDDDISEFNILNDSMDIDLDIFDMSESNISETLNESDLNAFDIPCESEIADTPKQREVLDCDISNNKGSASNEIIDLTKKVVPRQLNNISATNHADDSDKTQVEMVDLTKVNEEVVETIEISDSDESTVETNYKHDQPEAEQDAAQNALQDDQPQSTVDSTIHLVAIHHTYLVNSSLAVLNANCLGGNESSSVSNVVLLL